MAKYRIRYHTLLQYETEVEVPDDVDDDYAFIVESPEFELPDGYSINNDNWILTSSDPVD